MDDANKHTRNSYDIGVTTEPTIVISDVAELLEERIKLRKMINDCLNIIGAKTIQPIINPSIALYVKGNINKKEKVEKIDKETQSLPAQSSDRDKSIIGHSHQNPMNIIDHSHNFLSLNKNGDCLKRDLNINESLTISISSDSELSDEETHDIFQYNRRKPEKHIIAHIFPTAIMNIDSKTPQVIYAPQRKPTNRDRKRKYIACRNLFTMYHKNKSIRRNIFQLSYECPFCMIAKKECACVRWTYE